VLSTIKDRSVAHSRNIKYYHRIN